MIIIPRKKEMNKQCVKVTYFIELVCVGVNYKN